MRRLFTLIGAAAVAVALLTPSAAVAHAALEGVPSQAATPGPAPTATGGAPSPVAPATDDSSSVQDVVTVVGFTIVAGIALALLLRAGLRSAAAEDDD